jgi:hypothetical protein
VSPHNFPYQKFRNHTGESDLLKAVRFHATPAVIPGGWKIKWRHDVAEGLRCCKGASHCWRFVGESVFVFRYLVGA